MRCYSPGCPGLTIPKLPAKRPTPEPALTQGQLVAGMHSSSAHTSKWPWDDPICIWHWLKSSAGLLQHTLRGTWVLQPIKVWSLDRWSIHTRAECIGEYSILDTHTHTHTHYDYNNDDKHSIRHQSVCTQIQTQTNTHTHTHTHTLVHTDTNTDKHRQTHTHTNTHTPTLPKTQHQGKSDNMIPEKALISLSHSFLSTCFLAYSKSHAHTHTHTHTLKGPA